jgi:hypothetical protein
LANKTPDEMAREMGFKSAEQYRSWLAAQQRINQGPAPATQSAPSSVHELLNQVLALHPAYLLDRVSKAFDKAGQ